MTRARLCAEEDASMARKSACVFPLLGMWSRLNDSNFDCRNLTWVKYPCILSSLASNSPPTWLTTSLEFENIFMAFPPIFWTMDIPSNTAKPHTQPHCLWPRIPILMISHWWASRARPKLAPLQSPFNLPHHQHIPSRREVLAGRLCQPIFHPCFMLLIFPLMQVQWTQPPIMSNPLTDEVLFYYIAVAPHVERYSLSCWNAKAHSSVHSNPFHLFINKKKGLHLSADREINWFKAVVILVSFWTSLGFRGSCKLFITLTWLGLTSIPRWVTM